jgi:hypothetical protein
MGYYLKQWVGATLQEYQSSGHELDVLAMTPDGISIHVEVIWFASLQNFYRDMFMIQNSDANIKVVVANPRLLADEKCQRIFEKAVIAQRKLGVAMHGELVDGERVLSDKAFVESELKAIILKLIEHVQKYGKTIGRNLETTLPEPQIVDRIEEDLLSNLFPIVSFPTTIYSSPTRARRVGDVFRTLGPIVDDHPFLPKNRRLYTFDSLSDPSSVFAPIINKDEVFEESSSVWLNDEVRRNDLIYLFNLALEKYCRKRNMRYDRDHDRFVCLLKDGKDYSFGWRAKTKYIERKVARRVCKDGQLVFCIHYAARMNFMYINESLFLKVEPTKVFTSDGFKPIRKGKLASLMSRYLSKEYNSLYLSSVRFWAKFLSRLDAKLSIPIGNQLIEIDTSPAGTHMQVGIAHEEVS